MSTIVDNMILISSSWAHVLFDTGELHLFIFSLFANKQGLEFETLGLVLNVRVSLEKDCELSFGCNLVHNKIGGQ